VLRHLEYQETRRYANHPLALHWLRNNEEPGVPDTYALLLRCREHGVLWRDGGLENQPAQLMREFELCKLAVIRFERLILPTIEQKYSPDKE